MRESARPETGGLLDCDLLFHLELCELSRNPYLIEHARRILLPFFAFVRMRVSASGQCPVSLGQGSGSTSANH